MFEFLKTLLIILWVYYAFKLLIRWLFPRVLPWMMKKLLNRAARSNPSFGQQSGNSFDAYTAQDSEFKNHKKENPKSKKIVGEYIDFEEVED